MPWRTRQFADGFAEALRLADAACVCDVYVARGAADPAVTGELVVESALAAGSPRFPIAWTPGYADAADWIVAHGAPRRPRADAAAPGRSTRVLGLVRERLMSAPPGVEADAPLARLTTIGTGGPARFLARPASAPEAGARCSPGPTPRALDVAVIGLGSNLLVADAGYDGVALRLEGALAAIEIDGTSVRCGGGASLAAVVRRATEAALTGIEFGCAIPGTVGGAVRMNAGAYGSEIRDVLAAAEVVSATRRRARAGRRSSSCATAHSNVRGGRGRGRGRAASWSAASATRSAQRVAACSGRRSDEPAAQGAHVRVGLQEPATRARAPAR